MRRRDFITLLGGAAAWPIAVRGQQPVLPVVGLLNSGSLEHSLDRQATFRAGLGQSGYVEGQNVSVEYHWLEGQYDRLPTLIADLVRRRVAVIAVPGTTAAALAAKAATSTVPIVFSVGENPVSLGLVASLPRPGGNATGMNFFNNEAVEKRLALLHELLPKASPVAVLVNPQNTGSAEAIWREAEKTARTIGLPIALFKASTSREIESVFGVLMRERIEALFVGGDSYFRSRRVQFATLAARHGIATAFSIHDQVEAGGLMSCGSDGSEGWRQVGIYTGQILKGSKPADLPVVQSTKFQFVINMQTARALGIDVPPTLLARADKVIE
jgi:putative ABC transport system substrate-binding protein